MGPFRPRGPYVLLALMTSRPPRMKSFSGTVRDLPLNKIKKSKIMIKPREVRLLVQGHTAK